MDQTVDTSWGMILGWLERNCPLERPLLRGPADEEAFQALRTATGRDLPSDQLAWWQLSDGTDESGSVPLLIPGGWAPASTAFARHRHRLLIAKLDRYWPDLTERDNEPAGTATDIPWLPSWLPIAHDLSGGHLFLDLRDGPAYGCVGRKDKVDFFTGEPDWWGVAEMLEQTADALVNDVDAGIWHAEVEDGRLHWTTG